jgi:putative PEP-CTERM system histidine kinase
VLCSAGVARSKGWQPNGNRQEGAEMIDQSSIGFFSHMVTALGYAGFALWVIVRRGDTLTGLMLAGAVMLTAGWATLAGLSAHYGDITAIWAPFAETMRNAGWTALLVVLTGNGGGTSEEARSSRAVGLMLGIVFVAQIWLDFIYPLPPGGILEDGGALLAVTLRLAGAIGILLLVHNLYVAATPRSRWGVRMLCVALAAAVAYDLNLYTVAFLTRTLSMDLWTMRGVAMLIVLPLLIVAARRNRSWRIHLSRTAAFQTLSLAGVGGYLIFMALAAYGLRLVGGDWGRLLQIAFVFSTMVAAVVLIFSSRTRAWLRVKIAKHFFAYRYDYREEWLRFIGTVGRAKDGYGALPERVVQAVAELAAAPGGLLFAPAEDGTLEPTARWNWPELDPPAVPGDEPLLGWLAAKGRIVDLDEQRSGNTHEGPRAPEWLIAERRGWLIVPLIHIDRFAGMILLERPQTARDLNWEDFDLLRTVGRQAASFIAEASGASALADARKFDEFNRRFAFIMHDIKNLVSQLSLVSRNAERHADNPEFRADMVATLKSSVDKMNDLLARLSQHSTPKSDSRAPILLADIAREVVAQKSRQGQVTLEVHGMARVLGGRMEQVLGHLVQNAIDASDGMDQPVAVMVREQDDSAVIVIEDKGRGMNDAFIREELFKPFVSTKANGFGIGAYEARETIRGLGGRLDVTSREGEGSRFTIRLPLLAATVADKRGKTHA